MCVGTEQGSPPLVVILAARPSPETTDKRANESPKGTHVPQVTVAMPPDVTVTDKTGPAVGRAAPHPGSLMPKETVPFLGRPESGGSKFSGMGKKEAGIWAQLASGPADV